MNSNKNEGFTLIDMIIGVVLIAIAVIGSLEFYRYCYKSFIVGPKPAIEALNFAKESMEELCWLDSSDSAFTLPLAAPNRPLPTTGNFKELGSRFSGSRSYSVTDKGSYKVLEITVTWQN